MEQLRHEIRNAVLAIAQERRAFLRASSEYAKSQLRLHDKLGDALKRIESALNHQNPPTPIPEDAL